MTDFKINYIDLSFTCVRFPSLEKMEMLLEL